MYPHGYNFPVYQLQQTVQFVSWLDALKDKRAKARIVARLQQAEAGNLGDWKSVQSDVSEMRVDYGPGYRVYFTRRRRVLLILLCGGDKSSQARDIRRAIKLATEIGDL